MEHGYPDTEVDNQWDYEWKHANYGDFYLDLEMILADIQNLFFKVQQEDDTNA